MLQRIQTVYLLIIVGLMVALLFLPLAMQTFWKHRDTLMAKKYKGLGLWAMPNMQIQR